MPSTSSKKGLKNTLKTIIVLIVALVILVLIIRHFGTTIGGLIRVFRTRDESQIEAYLTGLNQWEGIFSVYFLSAFQVISIVLPGMAVQVAAGAIYRWWIAFLACYLGFVSANVFIFYFARTAGRNIIHSLLKKEKYKKFLDNINNHEPGFIVALAYMVPGIPNGIIPYLAAQSNLRIKNFALSCACVSWMQILCNVLAGSFLIQGQWLFTVTSFIVQFAILGLVIWKKDWFIKPKQSTGEAGKH